MKDKIIEYYDDRELVFADGFDDAIIGVCSQTFRTIYSVERCIEILMVEHDMSMEDAMDYFTFNVSGAYIGEQTPIWCETDF
jgi:hypothetical protein